MLEGNLPPNGRGGGVAGGGWRVAAAGNGNYKEIAVSAAQRSLDN